MGFPGGWGSKESAYSAGNPGSIPGSGRSPGEGNGNPLQHSCLENSMDRGAWRVAARGNAESDMTERLTLSFSAIRDQYPVFFTSCASLGLFVGRGCSLMAVRWQIFFSFQCSLGIHQLTLEGCNRRWLWHPWFLMWQEIFHFSPLFALICLSVCNAFFSHLPVKF